MTLPGLDKDGNLPAYAWPGGYPLFYLDGENSTLCPKCATASLSDDIPSFRAVDVGIHYEGPAISCDQCNAEIESAYGDPDAEVRQ